MIREEVIRILTMFLLKISIVYVASVLLFYGLAVLNRKLAEMVRNKAEEPEHARTAEESNPCHDDILHRAVLPVGNPRQARPGFPILLLRLPPLLLCGTARMRGESE